MAPIVRPVGNRPEIIAPFLDRGAWGVQVPHVNTADEARAAVDAVKYGPEGHRGIDRKSTRLNSSHLVISYAVFCLKKKKKEKKYTMLHTKKTVVTDTHR